jgi:general secretion pathway protein J
MTRRGTRGSPGFTLVEALIATLLMAIIVGALATVTAQWLPNWDRGFMRLQRTELLGIGLERVLADLAAAEFVSTGGGNSPLIFDGSELAVTFVRTALGPNAGSGLEIVRLAESGSGGTTALVRAAAPFFPGVNDALTDTVFGPPVVVIRAPHRISFAYAGPDRVWRDTWHEVAQLPRTVRVQVRDAATFRTLAVSTTAVIRAELPARCTAARTAADCPMLGAVGGQGTLR